VVTAKDYSFVRMRTPFADAWSCVYGFETVTRDGVRRVEKSHIDFSRVVRVVKELPNHPSIEPKKTSSGDVCGLCVEWSPEEAPDEEIINAKISKIRKSGLQVLYDPLYPMFDIIPRGHDKGMAVGVMREMLGVKEGLMFMGDSRADNPAFAVAEVGIGVLDDQPQSDLDCDYLIDRRMLSHFLSALLKNNLEFSKDLPGISAARS
jgi:hypothetical protein